MIRTFCAFRMMAIALLSALLCLGMSTVGFAAGDESEVNTEQTEASSVEAAPPADASAPAPAPDSEEEIQSADDEAIDE